MPTSTCEACEGADFLPPGLNPGFRPDRWYATDAEVPARLAGTDRLGGPAGPGESRNLVDVCLHLANVFYLASFLGRDMLHLRALTCVGLVLGIVFFSCRPIPLYGPTAWHVVFLAINALQIRRLVRERRRSTLTEEQERLGEATFRDLSREELLTLLTHATSEGPVPLRDLDRISHRPLDGDEIVLRDLAFSRLTRKELLNLLTRRFWDFIARRRLGRRGRPRRPDRGEVSHVPEIDRARRPAVG